jgi:hypothetical protein
MLGRSGKMVANQQDRFAPNVEPKRDGFISSSVLLLIAFFTAFFPRIITTMGVPAALNFLHFLTVPFAGWIALTKTRTKDRRQIAASKALLFGLLVLLTVNIGSALLNSAGLINAVLEFLLLGEPLLMLLAIISLAMTPKSVKRFRNGIITAAAINFLLAMAQHYVLHLDAGGNGGWDQLQGVFYHSGAGHVVSASVSITFALYYYSSAKNRPIWLRSLIVLAGVWQIYLSDTKQIFLVLVIALLIQTLLKVKNFVRIIQYLTIISLGLGVLYWAATSGVYSTPELEHWLTDTSATQQGIELKYSVFPALISFFHSPLNWILGLGPGHTVGRLGGWMIRDYYSILEPLGVTKSPASAFVAALVAANPQGDKSSMWSPFFGWAGIWGDLGFLGLGAYLFIWFIVLRYFCLDDGSRYLIITVFVFGAVFTQMEEPGYMLSVVSVLGLRWHELRIEKTKGLRNNSYFLPPVPY